MAVPHARDSVEYFHHNGMRMRRLLPVVMRVTLGVLVAICIAVVFLVMFILSRFDGQASLPADCAIVFGAAVYGNRPSPAVLRRVRAAVDLYHGKMVRRLFMTGGKGGNDQLTEAEVMQGIALRDGVPLRDITLEKRARSTMENIRFTIPLAGECTSVLAVSDEYHLARIELLARRAGWRNLQTYPAAPPESRQREVHSLLRETVGYLYYQLFLDRIWDITPTAL